MEVRVIRSYCLTHRRSKAGRQIYYCGRIMKKNLILIVACILVCACTPIPNFSHAFFMSDNKSEVKINYYDGDNTVTKDDLRTEIFIVDGKFVEKPNANSVTCRDFKIEQEQWRYDVQITNQKYPLYVSACSFVIKKTGISDAEKYNISADEIYDSIASQHPEYIGKYIIKIEDDNIHDLRKIAYNVVPFNEDKNIYIDITNRKE